MTTWKPSRVNFGLVLLGLGAASVFPVAWGYMTAFSPPGFIDSLRSAYPELIVWWIYLLYLSTVFLTLIPAAAYWVTVGGRRRMMSALLAVAPLVGLLLADFLRATLILDVALSVARPAWDALLMLAGAFMLFVVADVSRQGAHGIRRRFQPHTAAGDA